jgi:hypothetical protein
MVRELIRREFNVKLSVVSVGRLLRKLGLSPQRPLWRAYQQNLVAVERWKSEVYPAIRTEAAAVGATIYFGDEAGVRTDFHAGTTWAPVGQTPVVRTTGTRDSINLISALSAQGALRFSTYAGKFESATFINFCKPIDYTAGGSPAYAAELQAGLTDADQSLLAFQPSITIADFAANSYSWTSAVASGTLQVWTYIRVGTTENTEGNGDTVYQFVPSPAVTPADWNTVNITGSTEGWYAWTSPESGVTTGAELSLDTIEAANPSLYVDRIYVNLGSNAVNATIAYVSTVSFGTTQYEFGTSPSVTASSGSGNTNVSGTVSAVASSLTLTPPSAITAWSVGTFDPTATDSTFNEGSNYGVSATPGSVSFVQGNDGLSGDWTVTAVSASQYNVGTETGNMWCSATTTTGAPAFLTNSLQIGKSDTGTFSVADPGITYNGTGSVTGCLPLYASQLINGQKDPPGNYSIILVFTIAPTV